MKHEADAMVRLGPVLDTAFPLSSHTCGYVMEVPWPMSLPPSRACSSHVGSLFLFTKFSGTSLCINTSRECARRTGIKADLALQSYHKVLASGSESQL